MPFISLYIWLSAIRISFYFTMSHRYSYFYRWWALSCPKHVEKRNKHTKKNCVPIWLYLRDFFLFKSFQIGSHPAVDSLPGDKLDGAWTWPLNSSRIDMQNECKYSLSPTVRLHGVHKDNSLYFFCFISCLSRVNNFILVWI